MWRKPNKEEPKEVLAIGYQQEMLIGYVSYHSNSDEFTCESGESVLADIIYVIDLDKLKSLLPK